MAALTPHTLETIQAVPSRVQFKPHHLRKAVSGFAKRRLVLCNRTSEYVPFVIQPPSTSLFHCVLLDDSNGLHTEVAVQQTGDDYTRCSGCIPPDSSIGMVVKCVPPQAGEESYLYHSFQDVLYCHISGKPSVEIRLTATRDSPEGETKMGTKQEVVVFPAMTQLPQPPSSTAFPIAPAPSQQRLTANALAFTNNWQDGPAETEMETETDVPTVTQAMQHQQHQQHQHHQRPTSSSRRVESKQRQRVTTTDTKNDELFGGDGFGTLTSGGGFDIVTDNTTMNELDFYRNIVSRGQESQVSSSRGSSRSLVVAPTRQQERVTPPPLRQQPPPLQQQPPPPRNVVVRVDSVDDARSIVERMRARHSSTMSHVGSRVVGTNYEHKFSSTAQHSLSSTTTATTAATTASTVSSTSHSSTMPPISTRNTQAQRQGNRRTTNTTTTNIRRSGSGSTTGGGISLAEFDNLVNNSRTTRKMQRELKRQASTTTLPSGVTIDDEEVNFYRSHMVMETRRREDLQHGGRGRKNERSSNPYRDLVDASGSRGRAARVDRHIERHNPEVARLKELSKSPVRKGRRRGGLNSTASKKRGGPLRRRRGKRSREPAPAPPKSGELNDYWSTMELRHDFGEEDSSDEEEEMNRRHGGGMDTSSGSHHPPTAVERLEWESLRTEMTIAEINAERDFQTGAFENPEDDFSSSSDEEGKAERSRVINGGLTFERTVVSQTQDELDFYRSLILPKLNNSVESEQYPCEKEQESPISHNGPPSPLVRAMMMTSGTAGGDGDSDEGVDDMNDERWLAIDSSGDYMKEYEKELRRTLREEVMQ